MVNMQVQKAVSEELASEPRVDHHQIAVFAADDGTVTLRGTVGSPRQKIEAGRAVKRVYGVTEVKNELEVRPLIGDRRDDAELRGAVLQALALNSLVPSTIDAKAHDGLVTLTGTAHWHFERDEAELVAGNVRGVRGVHSEIVLVSTPSAIDVKEAIEKRLKRNAGVDADSLSIMTTNGTVTISGFVSSWAAHDAVLDAAWSVPNVTKVEDRILIRYF
jgi:osmotically-inducible protein OsmY